MGRRKKFLTPKVGDKFGNYVENQVDDILGSTKSVSRHQVVCL
jgi:hypothetical protein